jgi:hypothetical protein
MSQRPQYRELDSDETALLDTIAREAVDHLRKNHPRQLRQHEDAPFIDRAISIAKERGTKHATEVAEAHSAKLRKVVLSMHNQDQKLSR